MALRFKLRSISIYQNHHRHHFSTSILNPDSKTALTGKEKTRAALSLIRSEKNPERIIEICHAASLTPASRLDRVAYSKAIFKLRELNYFNGIRAFLEETKARSDMKSDRFMSHFIVLYGQAGMLKEAVKTFEEMSDMGIERNTKALESLLFSCRLANDFKEMKRVYMEFPQKYGIVPDLDVYNGVIKGFCESGETSSSFSILAEMERKGIKPNAATFGQMIGGFYEEEKFEDVGKVLHMMKEHNISPGIGTYNIRIKGLCKLRRSKEAKALFEGIVSTGMNPNNVTYTNLIQGFCKEGDFEEAKGLFERMKKTGVEPESNCYFTLVYFLCQGKDFEAALEISKECLAKNWAPNFSTMKALVDGLASISKVDEARLLIGQLKEKFSRHADMWTEIEEGLPK